MPKTKRKSNPIDICVGNRVRIQRVAIGMSQEKLAELIHLTFQQVQKYERGVNRISASKLFLIARALNVPVESFFEGLSHTTEDPDLEDPTISLPPGFREDPPQLEVSEFLFSHEAIQLNRSFNKIKDPLIRKQAIELMEILSQQKGASDAILSPPQSVSPLPKLNKNDLEKLKKIRKKLK